MSCTDPPANVASTRDRRRARRARAEARLLIAHAQARCAPRTSRCAATSRAAERAQPGAGRRVAEANARLDALLARTAEARANERARPRRDAGERTVTLDVSLLGRDYKVACKESRARRARGRGAFLDRRMREIRDAGKIAGAERIAVMAALNIAHELLRERDAPARVGRGARRRALTAPPRGVESPRCSPPSIRRWRARTSCSDASGAARRDSSMFPAVFELAIHSLNQCYLARLPRLCGLVCAPTRKRLKAPAGDPLEPQVQDEGSTAQAGNTLFTRGQANDPASRKFA